MAIQVIATTFDGTREALRAAIPLACGSGEALTLVVPQIVPYAVEIDAPFPAMTFFVTRYRRLIETLGGSATIDICQCRTIDDIVERCTAAGATTVVGGPAGHWLTSPEERFAGKLARRGCHVVFVATGRNPTQRRMPLATML